MIYAFHIFCVNIAGDVRTLVNYQNRFAVRFGFVSKYSTARFFRNSQSIITLPTTIGRQRAYPQHTGNGFQRTGILNPTIIHRS